MAVPRVFGFGTATLAFGVQGVAGSGDLLAHDPESQLQGETANCLVQAGRLGMHACWLGKLGRDWIGSRVLEELEDEGVDCSGALLDEALCSPFRVEIAGTEPRTVRLPNALAKLQIHDVEFLADQVNAGEWVVVEVAEIPAPTLSAFCSRARRRQARVLLTVDLDPIRQLEADPVEMQMLLAQADLLVPNQAAIRPLCENGNPEIMSADLARRYRCVVVLWTTAGTWYCDASGLGDELAACSTGGTVHASGCEAAFRGGLLAGLARGDSLPDALSLGSLCAVRTGSVPGSRAGMPRATELALDQRL
ncbi:MAG: carbohydrate kinase family protein [Victivallales bacterium]|jgi:2-dehydro-3-deoxygluconokinase|nr:carbohydrate kinase family protein [Victivallales bacterium]